MLKALLRGERTLRGNFTVSIETADRVSWLATGRCTNLVVRTNRIVSFESQLPYPSITSPTPIYLEFIRYEEYA